jgi:uncharacterized membrane protein
MLSGQKPRRAAMYNPHPKPFSYLRADKVIPCMCRYCRMVRKSAPTKNDSPKERKKDDLTEDDKKALRAIIDNVKSEGEPK